MSIPYTPGEALTCRQIRELDVLAIEHIGIPGLILMENAARSAAEFIYAALLDPRRAEVLLLCGPGNNGGDGLVIARHLHNAGVAVTVALAAPRERYAGDAQVNLAIYERLEAPLVRAHDEQGVGEIRPIAQRADVIVDALLGTGSRGAPREAMAELVSIANAAVRARRVAIDIPTGLNADSGEPSAPCFRADATVTFVAPKIGFAQPAAQEVLGRVVVVDIGIPRTLVPGREESSTGA
ncbi:MAG: NAD(P)H-hydrate epimerase [Planctomycetota bacterium]|nr:MAG: NAD(P)H-hydrate epimerase [Planctomycetota bacterium]